MTQQIEKPNLQRMIEALVPAREDLPRLPQQARSREKREELLKTAYELFTQRGYEETTSDDIALAAGVSVGTFYKYFKNKRQIMLTLIIEHVENIFSNLRLAQINFAQDNCNYRAEIRHTITEVLKDTQEQIGLRRVWFDLMARDPELAPYKQRMQKQILKEVIENLKLVIAKGVTWPNLDIELTAQLIVTLIDNINCEDYDGVEKNRLIDGVTDTIYRIIFHA